MKEDVRIAGSGVLSSGEYNKVKISGACKINGDIVAEIIKTAGTIKSTGSISAKEIVISGACKVESSMKGNQIHITGGLKVIGNIDAEELNLAGEVRCEGDINAESITIDSSSSTLKGVYGEDVYIGVATISRKWNHRNEIDEIAATNVEINYAEVKTIRCKNVKLGKHSKVDYIEYSDQYEVHPKAIVKQAVKI